MLMSYPKLLRVVCYIFRLLPKHAHFLTADKSGIDPAELRRAEEELIICLNVFLRTREKTTFSSKTRTQ